MRGRVRERHFYGFGLSVNLNSLRGWARFHTMAQLMSLQPGQHLGSYEITALLGKGGMGEVYRARDPRLRRDVAINVLPEEFSANSERISRFQREAEVLASLNHREHRCDS
jgi:serine/threonine protein kinase